MKLFIVKLIFTLFLFNGHVMAAASSLKCGTRIASVGNSKAEVLIKCGAPAWKDKWSDYMVDNIDRPAQRRYSVQRERWIYNFGPTSFLQILLFENGKLVTISRGSYGFDERRKHAEILTCDISKLDDNLTQYEVKQRCGLPFFTDTREEESVISMDALATRMTTKRIDEWTYNRGPSDFLLILVFENGMLVELRTGERGF